MGTNILKSDEISNRTYDIRFFLSIPDSPQEFPDRFSTGYIWL